MNKIIFSMCILNVCMNDKVLMSHNVKKEFETVEIKAVNVSASGFVFGEAVKQKIFVFNLF